MPRLRDAVIDAAGRWLTPGFIDIHGHGGGGTAFDSDADGIRTALALHRSHGTTRSVLSLVTASLPDLERQLAVIADAAGADPLILGSHLEGPFLDDAHRGAHDPALLRSADRASIDRLLEAARGTLVQVTLAPELPGRNGRAAAARGRRRSPSRSATALRTTTWRGPRSTPGRAS